MKKLFFLIALCSTVLGLWANTLILDDVTIDSNKTKKKDNKVTIKFHNYPQDISKDVAITADKKRIDDFTLKNVNFSSIYSIIIDNSGSMLPQDLNSIKENVKYFLTRVKSTDLIEIWTVNNQGREIYPLNNYDESLQATITDIKRAGNYSRLYDAIKVVNEKMVVLQEKYPDYKGYILFFSDGEDIRSRTTDEELAMSYKDIPFYYYCYSSNFDEAKNKPFLDIAAKNGKFYNYIDKNMIDSMFFLSENRYVLEFFVDKKKVMKKKEYLVEILKQGSDDKIVIDLRKLYSNISDFNEMIVQVDDNSVNTGKSGKNGDNRDDSKKDKNNNRKSNKNDQNIDNANNDNKDYSSTIIINSAQSDENNVGDKQRLISSDESSDKNNRKISSSEDESNIVDNSGDNNVVNDQQDKNADNKFAIDFKFNIWYLLIILAILIIIALLIWLIMFAVKKSSGSKYKGGSGVRTGGIDRSYSPNMATTSYADTLAAQSANNKSSTQATKSAASSSTTIENKTDNSKTKSASIIKEKDVQYRIIRPIFTRKKYKISDILHNENTGFIDNPDHFGESIVTTSEMKIVSIDGHNLLCATTTSLNIDDRLTIQDIDVIITKAVYNEAKDDYLYTLMSVDHTINLKKAIKLSEVKTIAEKQISIFGDPESVINRMLKPNTDKMIDFAWKKGTFNDVDIKNKILCSNAPLYLDHVVQLKTGNMTKEYHIVKVTKANDKYIAIIK